MDEDEALNERIRQMAADGETQPAVVKPGGYDYLNGAFQSALALGTSYVSRRMDIDLQNRVTGRQPTVALPTDQRIVADHADLTTRAVASAGGMRIGDLVPWIVAGGIAWLFLAPKR